MTTAASEQEIRVPFQQLEQGAEVVRLVGMGDEDWPCRVQPAPQPHDRQGHGLEPVAALRGAVVRDYDRQHPRRQRHLRGGALEQRIGEGGGKRLWP